MKNYCMNFVSIKNLATKAIKNIQTIKGGEDNKGIGVLVLKENGTGSSSN